MTIKKSENQEVPSSEDVEKVIDMQITNFKNKFYPNKDSTLVWNNLIDWVKELILTELPDIVEDC